HVGDHLAAAWRIWQNDEGLRVRDQPDLPHRTVRRVGRQRIETRERLHALDEADTALHPAPERANVRALATADAAVVAVQEPDELEAAFLCLGNDLIRCHRRASSVCRTTI